MLGKFIFCFVVALTVTWCLPVQAKIESNGSITYKEAVKAGKKSLKKIEKKSIRDIIREVLERHEKTQQTFPVPLYDSIYWDRMENGA